MYVCMCVCAFVAQELLSVLKSGLVVCWCAGMMVEQGWRCVVVIGVGGEGMRAGTASEGLMAGGLHGCGSFGG